MIKGAGYGGTQGKYPSPTRESTVMQDPEALHRRYRLDPRPMHLVRWLEALLQAGRHEDLVRAAEAEVVRFPDYPPLRMVLARAYMALGRWDRARPHLEEVLRRDAAHLRAWEALLEVAAAQDRWDEAATCLENLETLGWEPERLRLWRERLAEHGPSPMPIPPDRTESPPRPEVPDREPRPEFPGPGPAGHEASEAWSPCPAWGEAWAMAREAGPVFRRPPPESGLPLDDPGWYNLTVYWSHLGSRVGEGPVGEED